MKLAQYKVLYLFNFNMTRFKFLFDFEMIHIQSWLAFNPDGEFLDITQMTKTNVVEVEEGIKCKVEKSCFIIQFL